MGLPPFLLLREGGTACAAPGLVGSFAFELVENVKSRRQPFDLPFVVALLRLIKSTL
jgi:hypothetical protein